MGLFERFLSTYSADAPAGAGDPWSGPEPAEGWNQLLGQYGGRSFDGGIYRLHTPETAAAANGGVSQLRPDFTPRAACFGYDWLGRQFAVDLAEPAGHALVLLVEPGTGEVLEIPASFASFHDEILVDQPEAALAATFFDDWRRSTPTPGPLIFGQCVGYRIPLFLGGGDEVSNLELTDLAMYWEISVQLLSQTREAPPGTTINAVRID